MDKKALILKLIGLLILFGICLLYIKQNTPFPELAKKMKEQKVEVDFRKMEIRKFDPITRKMIVRKIRIPGFLERPEEQKGR